MQIHSWLALRLVSDVLTPPVQHYRGTALARNGYSVTKHCKQALLLMPPHALIAFNHIVPVL